MPGRLAGSKRPCASKGLPATTRPWGRERRQGGTERDKQKDRPVDTDRTDRQLVESEPPIGERLHGNEDDGKKGLMKNIAEPREIQLLQKPKDFERWQIVLVDW